MLNVMLDTQIPTTFSSFRTAARSGDFLITAEVAPPKGGNPEHMVKMAATLKGRVHAVNITDGSRAVLRMSPLIASIILLQNGIEPICQFACRDRNRIGLQADLMGAHALGVRNILALTGDPVKAGDHPDCKGVFDLEAVRLLQVIQKLNMGVDYNDKPLTDGTLDLFPGAAIDPQCASWSGLQSRFEKKLVAGAQFFQSQLITDFEKLEKFMNAIAAIFIPSDKGSFACANLSIVCWGIFTPGTTRLINSAFFADFNRNIPAKIGLLEPAAIAFMNFSNFSKSVIS